MKREFIGRNWKESLIIWPIYIKRTDQVDMIIIFPSKIGLLSKDAEDDNLEMLFTMKKLSMI